MTRSSSAPVAAGLIAAASLALSLSAGLPASAAQEALPARAPAASPVLTVEQQEAFLAEGRVIKRRSVTKGVTGTVRVTLTDGTTTHDASIQTIDLRKTQYPTAHGVEFNFRDSWKYNIAAYRLARLLGIDTIPPSVERMWEGDPASFTWWVDDVIMDDQARLAQKARPPDPQFWQQQIFVVRVFDQLIANVDRNQGNLLITKDWIVWMIDHSRSFRLNDTARDLNSLVKCDRQLLERLRTLEYDATRRALGGYVTEAELDALFKRRDFIVTRFDGLGPAGLYDLEKR
jgi:hypothetical protein